MADFHTPKNSGRTIRAMVEIAAILGVVAMIAYCRFTTEAQRVFHLAAIWLDAVGPA